MSILTVSCIANAGLYLSYLGYRPIYGVIDFDLYSVIAALIIVVILLSMLVGWLWRGRGGHDD